jgi:drug/metabolite transporter (DMT)-like permease
VNGLARGREAVSALTSLLLQREKTKRLLIGAACVFFIVAALVVVFAPPEKQGLAYALGAALVVVALGAIGASQFKFKLPGVVVETGGADGEVKHIPARHAE